jgi:outer membrane protein assembly factor BamB
MHVDTTFAMATYSTTSQPNTAQPLYLAGAGSVPDLVIVATNQNHVIAFNATNGAKVWDMTLGMPLPQSNLSSLKSSTCGSNLSPNIGITGTPIIDAGTRTIYLSSTQLISSAAKHLAYALNADDGTTKTGWPIDVSANAKGPSNLAFNALAESQRGALALLGGRVLIPYGGYIGDCGDYHGWVVSISTTDPTMLSAFATRAVAGGVWAPSGVASDGTSAFFATGNTQAMANSFSPPAMYGDGESVLKLPADLTRTMATTEYFVPTNWSSLDSSDTDIGGTGPLLVDVDGSTPSKLVVQLGKDGKAYLINRDTMGGQSAPLASPTVASNAIINAAAAYKTATATYVVFRGSPQGCPSGSGSLGAIKITPGSPPTAAMAWCAGSTSKKSPAVTMSNSSGADALVWHIGDDNKLRAYDGDTGAVVFNGGATGDTMTTVGPFQTPIVANGRIFVAANGQVYAFKP